MLVNNKYAKLWISHEILFFVYKPINEMDRRIARFAVNKRLRLQNQKIYPIFCDLREVQNIQREARGYFANEGFFMAKALAILVKDDYTRAITEFYVRVGRPGYPAKVFTSKQKALEFLEPFK